MSDIGMRDRIAQIIYKRRPAIQPWNGDPYEFHEPGARFEREKALSQADDIVSELGLTEQWTWTWIRPDGDRGYGAARNTEDEARIEGEPWMPIASRYVTDWLQ